MIPPRRYRGDPGTSVSRCATRPPVHDSAVATVSPSPTHRAWRRSASSTSGSATSAAAGLDRVVGGLEQPGLRVALRRQPPEVLAVEGEVGGARLPGPHLDGLLGIEGEGLARVEDRARR